MDIFNIKNSNKIKWNVFILLYLELNKSYYYLFVWMDIVVGINLGEVIFNIILFFFCVFFIIIIVCFFYVFCW